jgi:hypothetical protein
MVITVVVAAVIVVSHKIQQETLRLHGCLAVLALNPGNCFGNSALNKVQASIGEIVRPRHWRSR